MEESEIILSDTNIIFKIMLFKKFDLCATQIPGYGTIKFDRIVQLEISKWIQRNGQNKKVRKIEKFSLKVVEEALELARKHAYMIGDPSPTEKEVIFDQYKSILATMATNSANPTDNDLSLLMHAERRRCYMLTNDDIINKLGKKIVGNKSLELEDIFIALYKHNLIDEQDLREYKNDLHRNNESFKLNKVLDSKNRSSRLAVDGIES